MKTAQSIFILFFALWLPGCGVFGGTDNGQDNGSQDLGQTDLYPCGIEDGDYVVARFLFESGDDVVDLLPEYDAYISIESMNIDSSYGGRIVHDVDLQEVQNVKNEAREAYAGYEGVLPDELDDSFSIRVVILWSSPETANDIARKSGSICNPAPPFMREF